MAICIIPSVSPVPPFGLVPDRSTGVFFQAIMHNALSKPFLFAITFSLAAPLFAQQPNLQAMTPQQREAEAAKTEVYQPVPKVVTPGTPASQPPSDAIVLFDGKNEDQWV